MTNMRSGGTVTDKCLQMIEFQEGLISSLIRQGLEGNQAASSDDHSRPGLSIANQFKPLSKRKKTIEMRLTLTNLK